MIIKGINNERKITISETPNEGEVTNSLHPLLKKISEERWFPRDNSTITLDSVLDAISTKIPSTSKTMLKTLTTHLVQLYR
jgi:hypothetical protein